MNPAHNSNSNDNNNSIDNNSYNNNNINSNNNNNNNNNNKTIKYGPFRWELKQQFQGYDILQYNHREQRSPI